MQNLCFTLVLLVSWISTGQSNFTVENYPLKAMDLVVFPFGMEHPIPIGSISNQGKVTVNFPKDLNAIPTQTKANFMSDAAFTLFSKCDNSANILPENEQIKAVNAGYISLSSKDNPYAGLLFMVSNKQLVHWLESNGEVDAALGSYVELVYVDTDINYSGTCISTLNSLESNPIETTYSYHLKLKKGFNFINYTIERTLTVKKPSMYEENVFENITIPHKITVTSSQSIPPTISWIGKYF
ncbi:hypothetical protein MWU59_13845 [Flavobacteriaceae bacterium F08102]|nr:hypothetical protein [Flavobacteriaceae bacterium F08102]